MIGGINDIPNLIIFATTNYLEEIDKAALRRLPGKIFVGKPGPSERKEILIYYLELD